MSREKDVALVAITETFGVFDPNGYIIACRGPKLYPADARHKVCAFEQECEDDANISRIGDVPLVKDFRGKAVGLYIWEGEVKYPDPEELGEFDTSAPDLEGEIRDATVEDLVAFGMLKAVKP